MRAVQRQAGPVSRPVADPRWDVQSRASSVAYSVATAGTATTVATAATAPAAAYGPSAGGGRMRMMLPSPSSRPVSRPPSRPASVAGDLRRGNYDSPGLRFTPNRPPRATSAGRARMPMDRCSYSSI